MSAAHPGLPIAGAGLPRPLPLIAGPRHGRPVGDLSQSALPLLLTTILLWLTYGALQSDPPLIGTNLLPGVCVGTLVIAKIAWRNRP